MTIRTVIGMFALLVAATLASCDTDATPEPSPDSEPFALPDLFTESTMTLDEALEARRSVRTFLTTPLELDVIGHLFWSAQGTTEENGAGRTAPSAGGTYPLEVYVATGDGVLQYVPEAHRARWTVRGDVRPALEEASGGQEWVGQAPAVFVITGVQARTEARYGSRAEQYVLLEAGHAAQNLLLQATALELGAVPVGAFTDDVAGVLGLASGERPLYLIPVGHPVD
jgi:SagB-type dehydrogenase family enzyme